MGNFHASHDDCSNLDDFSDAGNPVDPPRRSILSELSQNIGNSFDKPIDTDDSPPPKRSASNPSSRAVVKKPRRAV
jgi:hypothetical protein